MLSRIKNFFKLEKQLYNWPSYIKDYFGLTRGKYQLELKNDLKYQMRAKTSDRSTFNEIWIYGIYTPEGYSIGTDDIVFDIGAHIGIFSILAASKARNGTVYSFEPLPENYSMLEKNVEINGFKNIKIFNAAVSGKSGTGTLYLDNNNTVSHSLFISDGKKNSIPVNTVSLDDATKDVERVNFIKIDCEGAEYEILMNASAKTLDKIDKISMEFHNIDAQRNGEKILEFLESKQFDAVANGVMIYGKNRKFPKSV